MIAQNSLYLPEQSFALNQLDLKLKPYLNFNRGFFIETGANNGINQSNTLYFEKYLNWQGILIEPIPQLAAQCKLNRPECIVENCALVPFGFEHSEIEMRYCDLMSLVKGAQKNLEEELRHIEKGCQVQNIESYELSVPARTLTSILDQHAVEAIDLLSLDVEGFELNVLKGLDFDRYKPDFLLIEARYREEIDAFLAPYYEPIAKLSHHDVLYKSRQKIEAENNISLSTPVAFFIFNRPDLTKTVFDAIAQAKPKTLLVIADGPRSAAEAEQCEKTRAVIDQVDWDCQILTNFSEQNLGCKRRIASGLDWVFSQVEEAIILEDDCLPAPSFFSFCQTLLGHYRNDERIRAVSGNNLQFGRIRTNYSYYFSRYFHMWGWATWRRAWQSFDLTMQTWPEYRRLGMLKTVFEDPYEQDYWTDLLDRSHRGSTNSWALIWNYTCWSQNGLAILPEVNLVANIGFRADATHCNDEDNPLADLPTGNIWKIHHPLLIARHPEADAFTFDYIYHGRQIKESDRQQQAALEQARQQQMQTELEQAQIQCQQLQSELKQLQAQRQQLETSLKRQFEAQQKQLKMALQNARSRIAAMESSKFWKLRTQWFRLRKRLGLGSE